MGCISQNGCLGPRRREKEVWAELVEAIYAEAERSEEADYEGIRARVTKKGLMRKLLDHLLSHRAKVSDCLAYNLRLAAQAHTLSRKLAALLVADHVTTQLSRPPKQDPESEVRTLTRTASSQRPFQAEESKVGTADIRLDLAYLRLVIQLLEWDGEGAVGATLLSVSGYCMGRRERLACRAEVWRVLELLVALLGGAEAAEAAACYLQLLELVREGGKEEAAHEGDLLVFLRTWLRGDQREVDSASAQALQGSLVRIIRLFVGRCLSAWDAKVLFRSLFQLYQDLRVGESQLGRTEEVVLGMVLESDLQAPILRGLFLYLLQFLGAVQSDRSPRASFNEEFQPLRYPHIYDPAVRLRLFQTLRRWGQRNYLNLDDCVTFGSTALVAAYTANLKGDREYVQEVVREFQRLADALTRPSRLTLARLLLEEARPETTDDALRRLLLVLARRLLEQGREGDGQEWSSLVVAVEPWFGRESRVQAVQLGGWLLGQARAEQLQAGATGGATCELLQSLLEGSRWAVRREEEVPARLQFANAVLSLLRCLAGKYAYALVLAFLGAAIDRLGLESDASLPALYFHLFVIYETMRALNPKHKLPDKMVSINFRILPSAKPADLRQDIEAYMIEATGPAGEQFPELRRKLGREAEALREFTMVSEGELRQAQAGFQSCFKAKAPKDADLMDVSRNQFRRESLNGSLYESHHDRSRNDDDESFKDIVERITTN